MRSVVVTGASTPLGRRLLDHLRREEVERVVGVEPAASSEWIDGVELVSFTADHRALAEFLGDHQVDTVIHCGLAPDRDGSRSRPADARVIETMRLGAAIAGRGSPVRSWVVASSSSVYPVSSMAPLLHREDGGVETRGASPAGSLLEAEEYVRDIAERAPYVNVAILRLQQLVGPGIRSPIASLLGQPILPSVVGFDPPLQVLAVEDAVRALAFAGRLELAGIYNVASTGTIRLSEAARSLERRALPVLPIPAGPFASIARRLGIPHVPDGMVGPLCFGHALDTSKLAAAGFEPEFDQAGCLVAFA